MHHYRLAREEARWRLDQNWIFVNALAQTLMAAERVTGKEFTALANQLAEMRREAISDLRASGVQFEAEDETPVKKRRAKVGRTFVERWALDFVFEHEAAIDSHSCEQSIRVRAIQHGLDPEQAAKKLDDLRAVKEFTAE